jgi:hypothetical protein
VECRARQTGDARHSPWDRNWRERASAKKALKPNEARLHRFPHERDLVAVFGLLHDPSVIESNGVFYLFGSIPPPLVAAWRSAKQRVSQRGMWPLRVRPQVVLRGPLGADAVTSALERFNQSTRSFPSECSVQAGPKPAASAFAYASRNLP